MATATKTGRGSKKNPVTPSRDEVIAKVLAMGGEVEKKRYEEIETLEKTHGKDDVLHRWKVGKLLSESIEEHSDDETIAVYSTGLQRAPQVLRLSVRLFDLYEEETALSALLNEAAEAGHELNWAHFRQLMRAELTDAQRTALSTRVVENRWGYRELKDVITAILGGKRSKGGRKAGQTKYKTYAGALSAMKMRSRAWLALEETWLDQVTTLVNKLREDEKLTPEFLALTNSAVEQLRTVADKAKLDADAAEEIALTVAAAMGNPKLVAEEAPEPTTPRVKAKPKAKPKAQPRVQARAKPKTQPKKKRVRLAKHPRMVNGKFVD
jgi:hypothetical protein